MPGHRRVRDRFSEEERANIAATIGEWSSLLPTEQGPTLAEAQRSVSQGSQGRSNTMESVDQPSSDDLPQDSSDLKICVPIGKLELAAQLLKAYINTPRKSRKKDELKTAARYIREVTESKARPVNIPQT